MQCGCSIAGTPLHGTLLFKESVTSNKHQVYKLQIGPLLDMSTFASSVKNYIYSYK